MPRLLPPHARALGLAFTLLAAVGCSDAADASAGDVAVTPPGDVPVRFGGQDADGDPGPPVDAAGPTSDLPQRAADPGAPSDPGGAGETIAGLEDSVGPTGDAAGLGDAGQTAGDGGGSVADTGAPSGDATSAGDDGASPDDGATTGFCGDGACAPAGESAATCPADCPAECGDGACTHDEAPGTCGADCPGCGDGSCAGGETAATCPDDCPSTCGDDLCLSGETPLSCPGDCPTTCGDGYCVGGETHCSCADDCAVACGDGCCTGDETPGTCLGDCPTTCGDGFCVGGETSCGCEADCGVACGNGSCDCGETSASCAADCPVQAVPTNACSDGGQSRDGCSNARIIGRAAASSGGWSTSNQSTCNANDRHEGECSGQWSFGPDHTYAIYLKEGELLQVTLDAHTTSCSGGGGQLAPRLRVFRNGDTGGAGASSCPTSVGCWLSGVVGGTVNQSLLPSSGEEGWWFIVVDGGASGFDEHEGYYDLDVALSFCEDAGCDCN